MDTPRRTFAKALTWQLSGLIVMTILAYIVTGSFRAAGGLAVAGSVIGFVTYFVHERLWARVRWGRIHADQSRR